MGQVAFGVNEYKEISKQVLGNQVSVLTGREGMGKSQYAVHLVKNNMMNVVFLCMTNDQVERQAKSFADQGIAVQVVVSKSAKLKELGVDVKVRATNKYFGFNGLDKKRTIAELEGKIGSMSEALEMYDSVAYDEFDLSGKYQIICATFAQVHQLQDFESDMWVVMMDDPDRELVGDLAIVSLQEIMKMGADAGKYHAYATKMAAGSKDSIWLIHRPEELKLTYKIKLPILLTTTESIVADLIVKNLGGVMIDYRQYQEAGDIHMFATTVTRKSVDFLIPVFVENLKLVEKMDVALIGDGMDGAFMTHKTAKGSNGFMDMHTVIDISHPHQNATLLVREELGIDMREAEIRVCLDMCHQSIGRNSGYRAQEGEEKKTCYVFCDSRFASEISKRLEYKHNYYRTTGDRQKAIVDTRDEILIHIHRFLRMPTEVLFAKTKRHYNLVRIVKILGFNSDQIKKFVNFLSEEILPNINEYSSKIELDYRTKSVNEMILGLTDLMNKGAAKKAA